MTKECDYGVIPPELSNCCGSNMIELNGKSYCLSCKEENYAKPTGTELHLPTTGWSDECNCKEMSCKVGCERKHTHKGFFCEKCNPPTKEITENNWEEHYPIPKSYNKIISEYVEKNDIKGLAEYFRAYIEDEVLETKEPMGWEKQCEDVYHTGDLKAWKNLIKQAEERAYDRGYGQWIMK